MLLTLESLLLGGSALASLVAAQVDTQLTGTWTTKSRKVFTGPVRAVFHFWLLIQGLCIVIIRSQKGAWC